MAKYKREYYFANSRSEEILRTNQLISNHLKYSESGWQNAPLEIQISRLIDLFAALADHLNVDVTQLIPENEINGRYTKLDGLDSD